MLTEVTLQKLKKEYEKNPTNKVRHRMLNKVGIVELITDVDTELNMDFCIDIKTHGITDQKDSEFCWIYAGLNIVREKVIETCNLDNFELSENYIAYFDKIERFNMLLERLISYKKNKRDLYDKDVASLLGKGITNGGYFIELAHLIKKYGVVPKNKFPDSYAFSNFYEINLILSRLLRMFYLELEEISDVDALKENYLEKAYTIISNTYGIPPEIFDFEYTDKNGVYHIEKDMTPKSFYEKYIGVNLLDEYIEVYSYEDEKIQYNQLYEVKETSRISGTQDNVVLNVSPNDFRELLIKQITNREPVYFYASTTSKRINGVWLDIIERYGELFDMNLKLDKNSILRANGITNCHCMLMTGVNIVEGEVNRWKIENSWGNSFGNYGYYVATNDWVEHYIHAIVINKKYLSKKQLELVNREPIKMSLWNMRFY